MTDAATRTGTPKSRLRVVALVFLVVGGLSLGLLFISDPEDLPVNAIVVTFVLALGLLGAFVPRVQDAVLKFLAFYLARVGWSVGIVGPLIAFWALSGVLLSKFSPLLRLLVLILWGTILLVATGIVVHDRSRDFVFGKLRRWGVLLPLGYSLSLVAIAVRFFAVTTLLLYQSGQVTLRTVTASYVSLESLTDFFTWHALKAIPLIEIPETLKWTEPLAYDAGIVGLMLLVFKITVILPAIPAFGWWWENVAKAKTAAAAE
jgi:hypothetical protein